MSERLIKTINIGGFPVNKVAKGNQILYKLAGSLSINQLTEVQRQYLMQEIQKLHMIESMPTLMPRPVYYETPQISPQVHQISQRVKAALEADHKRVLNPDISTPFKDVHDAIDRLLPYHVYQYCETDTDCDIEAFEVEAERKAAYLLEKAYNLHNSFMELRKRIAEVAVNSEWSLLCEKLLLQSEYEMAFMSQQQITISNMNEPILEEAEEDEDTELKSQDELSDEDMESQSEIE